MSWPLVALIVGATLVSCGAKRNAAEARTMPDPVLRGDEARYSPSTLIVMYDGEQGKASLLSAIKDYNAEVIYDYSIIPGMAIRKPEDKTLEEAMRYFMQVDGVTSVEHDCIYHLDNSTSAH